MQVLKIAAATHVRPIDFRSSLIKLQQGIQLNAIFHLWIGNTRRFNFNARQPLPLNGTLRGADDSLRDTTQVLIIH